VRLPVKCLSTKQWKSFTWWDIDEDMIAAAREFSHLWHQGAFDDPRMHLIFDDARKVVENFENGSLNVVISDLTEPFEMGPSFPLFH